MSKFLAKVIKKGTLLSILLAVIVAAATVIGILFGFNPVATVADGKKVTISVEQYIYQTEEAKADIKAACDEAFKNNNVLYVSDADFGGDGEFLYAFKANENIDDAVKALQDKFADWTKEDSDKYPTNSIIVSASNEKVVVATAEGAVVRAAIAGVVLAVLAFAYVAIRYNWRTGIVAAISVAASMLVTGAIVILARIPVTASVVYAIMASAIVTIVTTLFTFNKLRDTLKSEEKSSDAEELVASSIATKEIVIFTAILGAAILLVCIPAGVSAAWFALSAFIGVLVAAFIGLMFAPALYLPVQVAMNAKAASMTKHGYKGAKKAEKAIAPQAEEVKAEVKEEVAEPAPVEEAPAEESVEEVTEEVVEEPVEETEEPVEEIVEETEEESVDAE